MSSAGCAQQSAYLHFGPWWGNPRRFQPISTGRFQGPVLATLAGGDWGGGTRGRFSLPGHHLCLSPRKCLFLWRHARCPLVFAEGVGLRTREVSSAVRASSRPGGRGRGPGPEWSEAGPAEQRRASGGPPATPGSGAPAGPRRGRRSQRGRR